jgi:hypothetical protein
MAFRFWMPAFAGMSGREIVPAFSEKGEGRSNPRRIRGQRYF